MYGEQMMGKMDELKSELQEVKSDVNQVQDSLPQSWTGDDNGHDEWRDLVKSVNRNSYAIMVGGVVMSAALMGAVTVGANWVSGAMDRQSAAYAESTRAAERSLVKRQLQEASYSGEELAERIRKGFYDHGLNRVKLNELKREDPREEVLEAIASRKAKLFEKSERELRGSE